MSESVLRARALIESAFGEMQYPRGSAVVSAADGPALVKSYTNKDWRELTPEVLTYSSLYFFTGAGFQYFIPAFLLASLDEDNVELRGRVVRALAPRDPGDAAQEEAFGERVRLLTPAQRAAVGAFLDAVREHHLDEFRKLPPALKERGYWSST